MRRLSREQVVAALAAASGEGGADLTHTDLSGLDLSGMDFRRADLSASRLVGTNFSRAGMFGVTLNGAVATGANFDRAVLDVAVLRGTDLTRATFRGASLYATILIGATLAQADLTEARIIGALMDASLRGATLERARLGADPGNQPMGVMRTDLSGADLTDANLRGADLRKVNFTRATLAGADFTGADVAGAVLRAVRGRSAIRGLDRARNLDRAIVDSGDTDAGMPPASATTATTATTAPRSRSAAPPAPQVSGARRRVVLLDVAFYGARANSIEPGDSAMATVSGARIRQVLREAGTLDLVDSAQVAAAVAARQEPGLACSTNLACARAVAQQLGAPLVVMAKVSKTSNLIWYFSGQLVDVASGKLLMDDEFELKGVRDDMVPRGASSLARRIVKVAQRETATTSAAESPR